jgi:hypothetical protein
MSFLKRSIQKVFDFGKRAIKSVGRAFDNKWFRTAFLIGATFFTAGMFSNNYQGFGSLFNQAMADGSSKIGAFFTAVGNTISHGYSTITGGIKEAFGGAGEAQTGMLPDANPERGMTDLQSFSAANDITGTSLTSKTTGGNFVAIKDIIAPDTTKDIEQTFFQRLFSTLTKDSGAGEMLRGALRGGFSMWAQSKEAEREEEFRRNKTIYGGPAFGGSDKVSEGLVRSPFRSGSNSQLAFPNDTPQGLAPALAGRASQLGDIPGLTPPSPLLGGSG